MRNYLSNFKKKADTSTFLSAPDKKLSVNNKLQSNAIQPKLSIGPQNEKFEQEADSMADQVMRMSGSGFISTSQQSHNEIQRKCSSCEDEEKIQRKPSRTQNNENNASGTLVNSALRSGSSSLDHQTRSFFEPRFGADFSQVRIHADKRADLASRSIGAKAFTLGSAIAFRQGEYNPYSFIGRRLLAHELTHVVQQSGTATKQIQRQVDTETEAPSSSRQTSEEPVNCGNLIFVGDHWNNEYRSLVCAAFNALPAAAQALLNGVNIQHSRGVSMTGGEPGHYNEESNTVQLFCNVFGSCRSAIAHQNMTPEQRRRNAIRLMHHEFAHAMDLRLLGNTTRANLAAGRALRDAERRQQRRQDDAGLGEDLDSVLGIEENTPSPSSDADGQHRLQFLRERVNETRVARSGQRSASGMADLNAREQARAERQPGRRTEDEVLIRRVSPDERRRRRPVLSERSEPNRRIRTTRPTNEFQHAAELDGVRRITPSPQFINRFRIPFELNGGPVSRRNTPPARAYSNTNWMEMYAVTFDMYLNRSAVLQVSHPNIFSYFQSRFPR